MNGPQEPNAVNRAAARELRDLFNALTAEGFTEFQALMVVGQVIAGQVIAASRPPAA